MPLPLPPIRSRRADAIAAFEKDHPRPAEEFSPCIDQTAEDIAFYYRVAEIGATAVVRETRGGRLKYTVTQITETNHARGFVKVPEFRSFYMKHGHKVREPQGQTTLVVPTQSVRDWAEANPTGNSKISWRRKAGWFK